MQNSAKRENRLKSRQRARCREDTQDAGPVWCPSKVERGWITETFGSYKGWGMSKTDEERRSTDAKSQVTQKKKKRTNPCLDRVS